MEVDICIDEFTECLVDRASGKIVETEYRKRTTPIQPEEYEGWKFDWGMTEKDGYAIYELFLKGDDIVQGRISCKIDGGVADVDIVESAPHNFAHTGKYKGTGGHLFAIVCQISLENGCDGYVAFNAKNKLMVHYHKTLGAKVVDGQRMCIDDIAARKLIKQYFERKV